ncbi:MAG: LptF/LptG family permease [Verrucomicrobiota bacterium]|nr:MAG: LptF/LptG family permease [Verrucomicrobiota bacterium]
MRCAQSRETYVKQLYQYIARRFVGYLLLSILFFSGLLLVGRMMKDMMTLLIEGKLSLAHGVWLGIMLLPSVAAYALPFGFVSATLLTLGELSADREYIALRGAGISPLKIFSPILYLSIVGVVLALTVNFHYAPRAISSAKVRIQSIIREEPLRFIAPQKFIRDFPGYVLFVRAIDGDQLRGFRIWEFDEKDRMRTFIEAKQGSLVYDSGNNALQLTLLQGTIQHQEPEAKEWPLISFEKLTLSLSMAKIFQNNLEKRKIRNMTYGEMCALKNQAERDDDRSLLMEVHVGFQMKAAMAFGILALVLMAIPLSIRFARRETSANAAIAFLICVGYYVTMMLLSFLTKRPQLRPDLLLWLPNIVLSGLGIWGIRKLCCR